MTKIYNRDAFLENIARHLGRKRQTKKVERPNWQVSPQHSVLRGLSQDELVDILEKQCQEIHTAFKRTNIENLPKTLHDVLSTYKTKSMVVANDSRLKRFGLIPLFNSLKDEINIHLWEEANGKKNQLIAEQADVGISFSEITLAESGTVTLFINKNHGRSISLMPKSYIALIPKSTLVPRLTQATERIHNQVKNGEQVPSCISFVTGPSNSADIEMNLIVGVHGPMHATYIVIEDA